MFYRYYPPSSFDFILTKEGVSLRFSQPSLLNDPFELNPSLSLESKETQNQVVALMDKALGILSCSKNHCSHTMWCHYAQDHKGFMLDLDLQNLDIIKNLKTPFKPLNYTSQRPHLELFNFESIFNLSYSKDSYWLDEHEWRAATALDVIPHTGFDPSGMPIHSVTLSSKHINKIVLGALSSETLKKKARFWIENFAPDVQLFQSETSQKSYNFEYKRI